MGNSDRKTAAIRKLIDQPDCPRTPCSRSSETPETDAGEFEVIDDYECGLNVVSSCLARKLERERNALAITYTMTENQSSNEIRAALNTGNTRAFRNNIARINHQGRWLNFGIPGAGGSDLIGFHAITITPEMVGKRVAVFLAVECKSATGKPSADQTAFIEFVQSAGGIAGVANSAESALNIITEFSPA